MSVISKEILIKADQRQVWRHLEDPDLLAGWLMRTDFRPEAGAKFHFWGAPGGGWDGTVSCELVEIEPPRRLSFTWNSNTVGCDTMVTIELEPHEEGTLVRLHHTKWEGAAGDLPKLIDRHTEGWADHLWVLRKQAEEEAAGRQAPPIDWTQFRLFVRIDARPEDLFKAWATSRGMESFFTEMMQIRDGKGILRDPDAPAAAGDRYVWRWDSGAKVTGRYLAVEPGSRVGFTFGGANVSIRLHARDGWTLVELQQLDMEDTPENRMHLHTNCRAAWVYFLTILKVLMEHGVDGRDKTRAMGGAFSTYFDPRAVGLER